ncbi:uncharacterized protein LOC143574209 [Bidens hawaiensis]|uniref:uncharacterized protein LOC143574209 n=1 Tax=Bidens hawaiensis TaxID=980011 RepID=UPI00404B7DFF
MDIRRQLRDVDAHMEGWLDEPDLLFALEARFLAFAKRRFVYVIDWQHPDDHYLSRFTIGGPRWIEEEHVSALEWVVFDNIKLLAVGASVGYLLIYTTAGFLIHRQLVYPGRIIKLRVRGTKRDYRENTSSYEELCVVIQPGIIARFDGSDIQVCRIILSKNWSQFLC